ncbi:MAG TPA: DNA methyltransferase [Lacipirellulaceae bacterium]|nr:DNA methyltransferase [Lacipirellulaceae bacterium]
MPWDDVWTGDCLKCLSQMPAGSVDLAFADPPFNIGYEYDQYHDRQDADEYVAWSRSWMEEVHRVLKPTGTFWLSIGDEFAAELKVAAQHQVGFAARSWVVWYYTFGVNCTRKFSRSHAHLFHFVKDENNFTFNAEDPQVRVPSARALVYADKRANPTGRLPDDTWVVRPAADDSWVLRPQDLTEGFQPTDDTWYFARVAGTFKERQRFHGCQMPEQLLGRIVRVSSNPGDIVLDPFAGSGTTLAVAKKLGRRWLGCELSEDYTRAATERLNAIEAGESLDGPADPIASAPSTVNGRKLETGAFDRSRDTTDGDADKLVSQPTAESSASPRAAGSLRDLVRDAIVESFYSAHEGYSIDWLIADPRLQANFHEACRDRGLIGSPVDWNRELLRIRKTGEFPKRRPINKVHVADEKLDLYSFAAEIAWRLANDKFAGSSLDEIFSDPSKATYFDRHAQHLAPKFQPAEYRWAALRLRKVSRELVDEVKRYHFVFRNRDFARYHSWRRFNPTRLANVSGVYLLRNEAKQPLYVGRTIDLGRRLGQHADCRMVSKAVEHLSVICDGDLPAEDYQAAFKEDLVRRYQPRWNVNLVGLQHASTAVRS